MRLFAVFSLLLLILSSFSIAAASGSDPQASQVAAAVGAASGVSPTPGFVQGRLNDIQNRLQPLTGQGPNNEPSNPVGQGNEQSGGQGNYPNPGLYPGSDQQGGFAGGYGGPQGPYGGPNGGGLGSQAGPNGIQTNPTTSQTNTYPGQDYGSGPQSNGPANGGGQGVSGGSYFRYGQGQSGPSDFRTYSQFNLRPEDVEGWVYSQIGTHLEEHYGKEAFFQKCSNQLDFVNTIQEELKKSGIDINKLMCQPIQQSLSTCQDAQNQCEKIGGSGNGPQYGPSGQTYTPTCPPDENQIKQACLTQIQNQWSKQQSDMTQNAQDQCQIQWQYQQHGATDCVNGQPRKDIMCDHDAWIQDCLQHQPPQSGYGPGNGGYPPQGQNQYPSQNYPNNNPGGLSNGFPNGPGFNGQPNSPAQSQNPPTSNQFPPQRQCPPFDDSGKNACLQKGLGWSWSQQVDANGCPYYQCLASPQASGQASEQSISNPSVSPSQAACPPVDESVKTRCSAWSEQVGPGPSFCPYLRCDQTAQNTVQPTSAVTATPPIPSGNPTIFPVITSSSTPSPTQSPTATPAATASATASATAHALAINSWYLESVGGVINPQNPPGQLSGQLPGFGGPQGLGPNGFVPSQPNPTGNPPGQNPGQGPGSAGPQGAAPNGFVPNGPNGPNPSGNPPSQGSADSNFGPSMSPQDRCEQQWQRNQAFSAKICQEKSQQLQYNYCDEQTFISQCTAVYQKRMDEQHAQLDTQKICDIQTRMQMRELTRYCQNIQSGKEQCLADTKKGCDFGQQNFDKCQALTSGDNVVATIQKAVAIQCGLASGSGQPKELNQVSDLVPSTYKPLVQTDAYNVQQAQDAVKQVGQKDVLYALTQIIGLQADQEKKDAALLQSQCDQLKSTADQLTSLSGQLDSSDAKTQLEAQVVLLQQQKDSICANAKSKQDNASGIFSLLAGLFGGGGGSPSSSASPTPAPSGTA